METITQYVEHRVRRGEYGPVSVRHATRVLRQWHRHAGEPPWTTDQVITWVYAEHLRPNSQKVRLARLRPYCGWLVDEDRITTDPTRGVPAVRIPRPGPRDLDQDQVARLLAACRDFRSTLIVIIMVQCGLRAGDVARIRVEDIDPRRRMLHVRGKGGRGEPTHWVPIPAEAWDMLLVHLRVICRGSGPLIESRRTAGAPIRPDHVGRIVGRIMAAAGLKAFPYDGVSAHALRHTFATELVERGADIRQVQAALGHRSQAVTETYVRRTPPGLAEAMEGRSYLPIVA